MIEALRGIDAADGASVATELIPAALTAASFEFGDGAYSAGASISLPVDKLPERNKFRQSIIELDAAERRHSLLVDNIKLDVRQAWRTLQQARQSHEIQSNSVKLAEKRIESTMLFLDRGDAVTRDLLEAEEALLDAENAVARALVDHTLARLNLWRDMELLEIDEKGRFQEPAQLMPGDEQKIGED